MVKCHDCGVEEGQLHLEGCDMERCPVCDGQLISCGCSDKEVNSKGFRVPWVEIPWICGLCGELWPDFFNVSNTEWKKYVIPDLQNEILCRKCYDRLIRMFPDGWKMVKT